MRRDRMRIFAWVLTLLGPRFVLGYIGMARLATSHNIDQWIKMEEASYSWARIMRVGEMLSNGLVPAWTQVSPTPGIAVGLGMTAFGVVLLAIRRPAPRTTGDLAPPRGGRIASLRAKINRLAFGPTKSPTVPKAKAQVRPPWEKPSLF